ncbi:MAG TPA: CarD family transcriptional regulator, partial [Terrimesophilobacter sp.]|nr:CarD family transcriptional regulator [Terrimesophilobacter sp.]
MILEGLISALSRARTFDEALAHSGRSADFSVGDGLRAPLVAGLLAARPVPRALLAIVATGRDSESLREALASIAPQTTVIEFPAWETLPHERLSPSAETVGKRIRALRTLQRWQQDAADDPASVSDVVVVASVRAALQPLAGNLTSLEPVRLVAGGRGYNLTGLAAQLVDLAYSRVDMVTRRGEFAVRGGILDVFAPTDEHPVRVEFFGDEIEQIRQFAVSDQRSAPEKLAEVELLASRELLLGPEVRQRAREMEHEFPSLAGMLVKIAEGIPVDGMESLAPALLGRLVPLTHYLPIDSAVAVFSPERVASRAVSLAETNREFLSAAWHAATAGAEAPIDLDAGGFLSMTQLREAAGDRPWWTFSSFDSGAVEGSESAATETDDHYVRVEASSVPSFAGQVEGALEHVGQLLADSWSVVVVAQGVGLVERAADVLSERGCAARVVEDLPAGLDAGVAYLLKASVEHGFEVPELKLAVLSESEFYGRAAGYDARQVKKLASRRKNVVDPLQLKPGDHVVHQTHGVGRFVELVQRE